MKLNVDALSIQTEALSIILGLMWVSLVLLEPVCQAWGV
jgi:hypothetical protein